MPGWSLSPKLLIPAGYLFISKSSSCPYMREEAGKESEEAVRRAAAKMRR
jgi:hypothetical protein